MRKSIFLIAVSAISIFQVDGAGFRKMKDVGSVPKRRLPKPKKIEPAFDISQDIQVVQVIDNKKPEKKAGYFLPKMDDGVAKKTEVASKVAYPVTSLKDLKNKKLRKDDFSRLGIGYLDRLVVTKLSVFDDDVQIDLTDAESDYQDYMRERLGKKIDKHAMASMHVGWVNSLVGYGLFADSEIKKGQFVGECTGRIRLLDDTDPRNSYLFHYPSSSDEKQFVIDAHDEGNLMRFINHDSKANIEGEYIYKDGLWHLVFISTDSVKPGDQLKIDYGPAFWKGRKSPTPIF